MSITASASSSIKFNLSAELADLDITLASDGTLTKAVGKTTDSTFEKLLAFMPKTDSLLDKGKAAAPAAEGEAQQKGDVSRDISAEVPGEKCRLQVSLKIERHHVRHIWFKDVSNPTIDNLPGGIRLNTGIAAKSSPHLNLRRKRRPRLQKRMHSAVQSEDHDFAQPYVGITGLTGRRKSMMSCRLC